jgi:xylan 1,4-beta-xylosidase
MAEIPVQINVNAGNIVGNLPHSWNYIGYDECNYTYTPEGRELLAKFGAMQEKPYYVRAHHLFCTGNGHGAYKWGSTNVYLEDEQGNPKYDWKLIDLILDAILEPGLKPFVELGFMPQDLADPRFYDAANDGRRLADYRTYGWACPPKDYQKWYDLIFALVRHCLERYGETEVLTWYWELWNEPDGMYWKGTIDEFNKLYDYTAAAVKAAHPQARIGGPATTGPGRGKNAAVFLDRFCSHVVNETNYLTGEVGAPIDYVSFHVKGGGYRADPKNKPVDPPSTQWLFEQVQQGYEIISCYPGLNQLECVLSEADPDGWAAGGAWDNAALNFRNTQYYASYVACTFEKIIRFGQQKQWDVRPLTWAFMFVAERCFEGTRAFSTQGIDKAVFNLFKMYARMGAAQVALSSSGAQDPNGYTDRWGRGSAPDLGGFATLTGEKSLEILLFNHHDDWNLSGEVPVELEVEHLPFAGRELRHYRIDAAHSNAYAEWLRQGKPMYPHGGQYAAIKARDGLELLEPPRQLSPVDGCVRLAFNMPVHSVSLLIIS